MIGSLPSTSQKKWCSSEHQFTEIEAPFQHFLNNKIEDLIDQLRSYKKRTTAAHGPMKSIVL